MTQFCATCHNVLTPRDQYCRNCGARFSVPVPSTPVPQSPTARTGVSNPVKALIGCAATLAILMFILVVGTLWWSSTPAGKAAVVAQERNDALEQQREAKQTVLDKARLTAQAKADAAKPALLKAQNAAAGRKASEAQESEAKREARQEKIAAAQQQETDAEQEYRQQVSDLCSVMSQDMTDFAALGQNPDITDDTWKEKMAHTLSVMEGGIETGRGLHAPSRYRQVQKYLNKSLTEIKDVPLVMANAIDTDNRAEFKWCGERMARATVYMNEANAKIREIGA